MREWLGLEIPARDNPGRGHCNFKTRSENPACLFFCLCGSIKWLFFKTKLSLISFWKYSLWHNIKIFQNHLYFLKFSSSYIARVQKTDKIILNTVRMVLLWQEWQCHEYLTLALYFTIYKSMGFLKYLLSWTSYQLPDTRVITSPINESMS